MRLNDDKMPESLYVRTGGELRLSNLAQLELLRGFIERGKTLRTRVRGFSMIPFINDGDVITISPMDGKAPKVGEVVAFIHPGLGQLAVHRIIARKGDRWLIRGDSSTDADGLVRNDQLIGQVTCVEHQSHPVRFGLGREKRIIAWLARYGLLLFVTQIFFLLRQLESMFFNRRGRRRRDGGVSYSYQSDRFDHSRESK
jgi:hypothetical protein